MSTHQAEAFHAGVRDGHNDAQSGRRKRRTCPGMKVKARDGSALIYDQDDANAYKSGYIRSYQDERGNRRHWRRRRLGR
jgi:hypothetical protein